MYVVVVDIKPPPDNFNTWGGVDIYPLPDNIIFPCMYVVVVDIYNSLPDNFDMMDGRYVYPLSTVITYTTGAPPGPLARPKLSRTPKP